MTAAVLYLSAAVLVARRLAREHQAPAGFWLLTALSAVALHALHHVLVWRLVGALDLHFFAAISLVGLAMAALTTLYAGNGRMGALGVVVFPLAALALLGHECGEGRHDAHGRGECIDRHGCGRSGCG